MKKRLKFTITAAAVLTAALVLLSGCASVIGALDTLISPDEQMSDQGMTSELHKANVGKILFSTEAISVENPNASKLKTSFTQDDNIYGRFYLSESLEKHVFNKKHRKEMYPKFSCYVYVDNVLQSLVLSKGKTMADSRYTTRYLDLRVPRSEIGWGDTGDWVKFVNSSMNPGTHLIRLEVKSDETGLVVASGEFTYVKGKTRALYGTSFNDYKAGKKDKALERDMFETAKQKLVFEGQTLTALKIKSNDWYIVRDELGNIVSRGMDVWLRYKKEDGTFWVRKASLGQGFDGTGYLSSFYVMDYKNEEEVDE